MFIKITSSRQGLSCCLSFLLSLFASFPVHSAVVVVPPGVTGSYRLAFVTNSTGPFSLTTATSIDINYYDSFVTSAALATPELAALNTTWQVIGSTPTVSAIDRISLSPDVPVYNLGGLLVDSSVSDLFTRSGNMVNPMNVTPDGSSLGQSDWVWTGTDPFGVSYDTYALGGNSGYVAIGYSDSLNKPDPDLHYLVSGVDAASSTYHLYALSGVIAVPEPSSSFLMLMGCLILLVQGRKLKRQYLIL